MGGAVNGEERGVGTQGYKGAQDAKSESIVLVVSSSCVFELRGAASWCVFGLVVVFEVVPLVLSSRWCLWSCRRGGAFSLGAKSCGLCAVARVEARRTRTGGAAYQHCRAACAPGRRAPERARLPSHHEGAGNQHRSRGARSVIQAPRHIKVYGPCLPPSSFEGGLFLSFE